MTSMVKHGNMVTMETATAEKLLKEPLFCHKCGYAPSNMPKLNEHLLQGHPDDSGDDDRNNDSGDDDDCDNDSGDDDDGGDDDGDGGDDDDE